MNENEKTVIAFINSWSRLDPKELTSYFADDGIYHNIPLEPAKGKKAIEDFIKGFTANYTETRWDILNVVSRGHIVMAERVDRTKMEDGKSVDLPVVGVFEMENGKIKIWREYFDLGTYMKALE